MKRNLTGTLLFLLFISTPSWAGIWIANTNFYGPQANSYPSTWAFYSSGYNTSYSNNYNYAGSSRSGWGGNWNGYNSNWNYGNNWNNGGWNYTAWNRGNNWNNWSTWTQPGWNSASNWSNWSTWTHPGWNSSPGPLYYRSFPRTGYRRAFWGGGFRR